MGGTQIHPLMRDRTVDLPAPVVDLLERAVAALDMQDAATAERVLNDVLAMAPECAEAMRLQGLVRHLRGDYVGALAWFQQARALLPDDPLIRMNLATALFSGGAAEAAISGLQHCCAMAPDFAPAWYNLGKMYMLQQRPAGAVTVLHRALDAAPEHVSARLLLAQAQASLGAAQPASRNYREVLRLEPGLPAAWIGLAEVEAARFSMEDVAQLQRAWQSPRADVHARACLGFALTRALEDQGDYAAAFRALRKANSLMYRQVAWNAAKATAQAEAMRRLFAKPLAAAVDAGLGAEVVFVVGLPQAGTLLTGQILAAHPAVAMVDERGVLEQVVDAESTRRQQPHPQWMATATPVDWQRLGQEYLARIEPWRRRKSHFVDRTPGNWQLVGAIRSMLPGAHVVNSRRGALETCFACYRQLLPDRHGFSYDLDHMVGYWCDYDGLSRHWLRTFPANFLDHDYEAWRSDPAPQVRRLLDFCGLPFDPACVELHRTRHVERPAGHMAAAELMTEDSLRCTAYGNQLDRLRGLLRMRTHGN